MVLARLIRAKFVIGSFSKVDTLVRVDRDLWKGQFFYLWQSEVEELIQSRSLRLQGKYPTVVTLA